MTTLRAIPRELLPACMDRLMDHSGKSREVVNVAYRKWQRRTPAEPCRYGPEKPIALDCRCRGCVESLCYLFFDTVAEKFAAGLTPYTKGFD